ncbi:MAG: hypothetical protein AB7G47_12670 [Mycolicibacterium sp.]|uniref:hypothetical protein n=1 Tax=Mycolicibacterium sp. TaxID=2320850 RepID=UPI003D14D1E7
MTSDSVATTGGAAGRLERLRETAKTRPVASAESAWAWIAELAKRAKTDAAAADAECNELFRLGVPPTGLDGPTDGMLVMTTTNPAMDAAVRAVAGLWMPWQGKRFHSDDASGENRMTKSSTVVSKLLWPLYSMRDAEQGKLAFDFQTYVEAGKDDPDRQVMVIDYANIEKNPRLLIRSIRDELVELVDGVFFGKILYRSGSEKYSNIGYFALRMAG